MYPIRFKTQSLSPFSRLMEDFFENEMPYNFKAPVNIQETEKGYTIELAVPGFSKEEFSILVENRILRIKGEHVENKKEESEKYTRREFSKSSFERSFSLPSEIKEDDIEASYENGILKLELTRKISEPGSKNIQIK